nr:diguanylate cyclase [uncultured Desulfobacter sp.]
MDRIDNKRGLMGRIRLFWILLAFQLIVLIIQFSLVNFGTVRALKNEFNEMVFHDLSNQGHLLHELISDEEFFQYRIEDEKIRQLTRICNEGKIRLTLMDTQGVVFFDSHHDYRKMENHAGRPEMKAALQGQPGKSSRYSNTLEKNMFYYAVPYLLDAKIIGAMRIAFAEEKATEKQIRITKLLTTINLIILLLTAIIVAILTNKLRIVIHKVETVALKIGEGDPPSEYPKPISRELTSLVETIAQMSEKITKQQEKLTQLTLVDGLTGLGNRRKFDEALAYQWQFCRRSDRPLSFLIIDIDYFKRYNDTLGHPAGDECLKQVAALLTQTVSRQTDLVIRLGGEEFGILMPDTDKSGAVYIAQHIHDKINTVQLPHPDSPVASYLTFSMGLETLKPSDDNIPMSDLFESADKALYQAKHEGRNRIQVFTD